MLNFNVCRLAVTSTGQVGFLVFVGFSGLGAPEGSTSSGSGFKVSQKTGPADSLKSHPTNWESRDSNLGLQGKRLIHYTMAAHNHAEFWRQKFRSSK